LNNVTAILNARIYTVDKEFRVYPNGVLVFDEDAILSIGESGEIHIPEHASVIDGKGRVAVLPGLIDVHSHSSLLKGFSENAQLLDWLSRYQREHRVLTEADAYFGCLVSYLEALKGGTTTVVDMYRFLHKGADAARTLGLRVHLVPYAADHPTQDFFETLETSVALIEYCGKFQPMDVRPWLGLEHITYCSENMFRKIRDLSDRYGVNIHTHTSEQREEVAVVQRLFGDRPVKKFHDWGILKPGTVLAHCVWLDDAEIALLADTGTGVAHCPVSNMKLASGAAPVASFKAAGLEVGLGSDGGISNNSLSMWECMKVGSLLQKVTRLDATALGAEEAIRMATIDGARLLGVERHIGSLEAGKLADVIMIDLWQPHLLPVVESEGHDPVLWNLVFAAQSSDVQHVWVGGRRVMSSRRLTGIDEDEALQEIHARTFDLLKRRARVQALPVG